MTKKKYQYIFLILTKCILTILTGTGFWILFRTMQMTCYIDPAFYLTVPEQISHLLASVLMYVVLGCAGSYAVQMYDT